MTSVVITHIDLDGVVSGWLASRAFNTMNIVSANYHEVPDKLQGIYNDHGSNITLVCTDLNFEPKDLQWAIEHFDKVRYFDHHPSSENFLKLPEVSSKFKIWYSDTVCATTLVYQYMVENDYVFSEIDQRFFRYVNIYDTWKEDHPHFIYARMLNDVFWYYGWTHFLRKLQKSNVFDVPKGLSHEELKHCKETYDNIKVAGETAEWFNTDEGSTVVILEKHQKIAINHVKDYIPSTTGIYYIFYYSGQWRSSIRVATKHSGEYSIGEELRKYINSSKLMKGGGGHDSAAACHWDKDTPLPDALTDIEEFDKQLFLKRENK